MQQRTNIFAQTPVVASLADILQSPADFGWSATDGNLRTSVKIYFKNKRDNSGITCVISDIKNFNIPEFNLYYLATLNHLYQDLSCTAINTFMSCFFFKLEELPLQTQERYLQQFFANTTYVQLHGINPFVARRFMRFLLDSRETLSSDTVPNFRGIAKAPAVLLQFADYLADCQTKFPRELLENGKITESIASCYYKTLPQSVRSKMRVEGSFGLKTEKTVYELAEKKIKNAPNGKLSPEDLKELKKAVLERNILYHQLTRYPVPEPMQWEGQRELLNALSVLEGMTQYPTEENRVFLRLRIADEQLLNCLLITNVRSARYICHDQDMEKLPSLGLFNGISFTEYFVNMPSGRTFAWTESLSKYIEKYNVLPSKEFLILFDNLVSDCWKNYLPAAGRLATYLQQHPLVLEKDNVRPAMSQRM